MPNDESQDGQLRRHNPSQLSRQLRWSVAIALILIVLIILMPMAYHLWRLWQVPDIGNPFAVSQILKQIPEEDNAFPGFEEAFALWIEVAKVDFDEYLDEVLSDGWDATDNHLNKYLEFNRPALEKWREATEKENYQIERIAQIGKPVYHTRFRPSRDLVLWCQMEIERLTKTGRPAEAIPWLRASFRYSSLITRDAPWLDRLTGSSNFAISARSAVMWMQHPDLTSDELLGLLSEVQASVRLMEKLSTTVKVDYLASQQEYAKWSYDDMEAEYANSPTDPPLGSKGEAWLMAEPEFSRRLSAHVTANLLVFVDNPRRDRPAILDGDIFDDSAVGAAPAGRLPAHELVEVLKHSKLIHTQSSLISDHLEVIDRQQARNACLQVALAAQAYYRDHDEFPARAADLQPHYLTSLPDDPYVPRPMPVIYRRTDDEAVVYSRFTNEIDDGGTTVTFDEAAGMELHDFGYRIRTPRKLPTVAH